MREKNHCVILIDCLPQAPYQGSCSIHRTGHLLVHGTMPKQLSHTSQDWTSFILEKNINLCLILSHCYVGCFWYVQLNLILMHSFAY